MHFHTSNGLLLLLFLFLILEKVISALISISFGLSPFLPLLTFELPD